MKRVLIVSPRFPPTNAPDMHRVRQSLPYFADFGWQPTMLAVRPELVDGAAEPLLVQTVSPDADVKRVGALPSRMTRKIGLGDLAIRSLPFLYRTGARIIKHYDVALTYFSTTAFAAVPLGRVWKERFGVPFVVDMQDPWLSDYYKDKPASARPPKYWFSQRLHGALEPWTMKAVDGLVSVSPDYLTTLRQRYAWLADKPQVVLPFAASEQDFDVLRSNPQPNRVFRKEPGRLNGVYVGRGGRDMEFALHIMLRALKLGLEAHPQLFGALKLHFIGTDYATDGRARTSVAPLAERLGVSDHVEERTARVPYFEALQLLRDADFLLVPGSDDPQYTASKIFPYILARKPLLAAFHRCSSVCRILSTTGAGDVVTFDSGQSPEEYASRFVQVWAAVLRRLPFTPGIDRVALAPYTAREMTRAQCALFDEVLSRVPVESAIRTGGYPVAVGSDTCSR